MIRVVTKFNLAEASEHMSEAVKGMSKAASLLEDRSGYFNNTISEINEHIDNMTKVANIINDELKEII